MTLKMYVHRSRDSFFMAWTPSGAGYEQWTDYQPSLGDCRQAVRERFKDLIGEDIEVDLTPKQLPG